MPRSYSSPALLLTLALAAAACSDRAQPLEPILTPPPGTASAQLECRVSVREQTLECARVEPSAGGSRANRIVGGQELYVRLASSGTEYDQALQQLRSHVTLQNLMQMTIGTEDGSTVQGSKVFLVSEPVVTSGTGDVTVANPDGYESFTAAAQPYFHYDQLLTPFEISEARQWRFDVPASVGTFTFSVYVDVAMPDATAPMLGAFWTGDVNDDWFTAGNWLDGLVPGASSMVSVPVDSLISGAGRPVLSASTVVGGVRVGSNSTLDLAGFTLEVQGNVDASGPITGGTVHMSGSGSVLDGQLPALRVTAGVQLQGAVRTSGAVSISDGSLTLNGQAFSISVP